LINNRKNNRKASKLHHKRRHRSSMSTASSSRDQKSSEREIETESDAKESASDARESALEDDQDKNQHLKNFSKLTVSLSRHKKKISLSGSVSGRQCIIVDDMIDTGSTLKDAIETLRKFGARGLHVMATHAIFSGQSLEILQAHSDFIRKIVVTNTVPQNHAKAKLYCQKYLEVIDVSGLIAEYIRRHHYRESVQVLCHFMPIRDEDDWGTDDESDDNENIVEIPKDISLPADVEQPQTEESPRDLRLMHLRKGFRLSSITWED